MVRTPLSQQQKNIHGRMKTTCRFRTRRDEKRIPELLLLPSLALVTLSWPGLYWTCGSAPLEYKQILHPIHKMMPSVKGTPSLEWYQIFLPTSLKSTMGRYPHSPGHTAFGQQEGFKGWIGSGEQKWEITQSSPSTLTVSSQHSCLLAGNSMNLLQSVTTKSSHFSKI